MLIRWHAPNKLSVFMHLFYYLHQIFVCKLVLYTALKLKPKQ